MIEEKYPFSGAKIDWKSIPCSISKKTNNYRKRNKDFIVFFHEMKKKFSLSGDVFYVNDSAIDFAIKGSIESIGKIIKYLLKIPQHHYFIGNEGNWCLCFTMEGYMDFGFCYNDKEVSKIQTAKA